MSGGVERENDLDEREDSLHVHHWLDPEPETGTVEGEIPGQLATPKAKGGRGGSGRRRSAADREDSADVDAKDVDRRGSHAEFNDGWAGTVARIEMEAAEVTDEHRVEVAEMETRRAQAAADERRQAAAAARGSSRGSSQSAGSAKGSIRDRIAMMHNLGASSKMQILEILNREEQLSDQALRLSSEVAVLREERASRALAYLCLTLLAIIGIFVYALVTGVSHMACDGALDQPLALWHLGFGVCGVLASLLVPPVALLAARKRRGSARHCCMPCAKVLSALLVAAPALALVLGVWWSVSMDAAANAARCDFDMVWSLRGLCIGFLVFLACQPLAKLVIVGERRVTGDD